MADHPIERLNGKTPLQHAHKPYMDKLARMGRTGRLITVPEGFPPGSEVANTAILGYDLEKVYEGRGPLEAASIGYEMRMEDLALRCNIITLADGKIITHNGGNLQTADASVLIDYLNKHLANDAEIAEKFGENRVQFIAGIQYRHLLIIRGGNKHIDCAPPHDHPNEPWRPLLVKPANDDQTDDRKTELTPAQTAELVNMLILKSQELLEKHPFNQERAKRGERQSNSIWPWSGGYRPSMETINQQFPQVKSGAVISAVDLIRGIGHYAIEALKTNDFVFLHVEASDEAGHDGDLELKIRTIENLDSRIIGPIYEAVKDWDEPVCIAVLPDHPTPVEMRIHVNEPIPFLIYHKGIEADGVQQYDEVSCVTGGYGLLRLQQFMQTFMRI